jgi:hypothetical protein
MEKPLNILNYYNNELIIYINNGQSYYFGFDCYIDEYVAYIYPKDYWTNYNYAHRGVVPTSKKVKRMRIDAFAAKLGEQIKGIKEDNDDFLFFDEVKTFIKSNPSLETYFTFLGWNRNDDLLIRFEDVKKSLEEYHKEIIKEYGDLL